MIRKTTLLLVLAQVVLVGCLGTHAFGESGTTERVERKPPELTVQAMEPLNVNVEIYSSRTNGSVLNETFHMELGNETTFGSNLPREPHTFVLRVDDRVWRRSVEPGQHLTVRVDADGNVTVVSNAV